jgi:hypothetical protein
VDADLQDKSGRVAFVRMKVFSAVPIVLMGFVAATARKAEGRAAIFNRDVILSISYVIGASEEDEEAIVYKCMTRYWRRNEPNTPFTSDAEGTQTLLRTGISSSPTRVGLIVSSHLLTQPANKNSAT